MRLFLVHQIVAGLKGEYFSAAVVVAANARSASAICRKEARDFGQTFVKERVSVLALGPLEVEFSKVVAVQGTSPIIAWQSDQDGD